MRARTKRPFPPGSADFNKFALAHSSLIGELRKAGYNPDKVRMGIIGFGNMGQGHAKSIMTGLVPKMTLAAVCDTDPEKAKKAAEMYHVPVFTDDDEMLKSGLPDAVLIAVPHYDHPVLAKKAFAAGLNAHHRKAGRGIYKASYRNERCRKKERPVIRHHVQSAHESDVPEGARNGEKRLSRPHQAHFVDHHGLVPPERISQQRLMALALGDRGQRRS